jgi:hypothetical protein
MAALWGGLVSGSVRTAMPAFFPQAAYVQLKAVWNARSDYLDRLVEDYRLDLAAARTLLEATGGAATARLVRADVPAQYGHWVPPGTCDNSVGYFEVADSRLVYRQHGQIRSLGIASMISWRGVWYVIHMGAVVRSTAQGVVDNPQIGAGSSAPSSTC